MNRAYPVDADATLALTLYQLGILRRLANGQQLKAIALAYGRSVHTMNNTRTLMLHNLGVHSTVEAVVYAMRMGWIS